MCSTPARTSSGINSSIDRAVRNGIMSAEESAKFMQRYKESLGGYTYLLWENSPNTVAAPASAPAAIQAQDPLRAANVG